MYITRGRSCMHEELFCIHMKELLRRGDALLLLLGMLGSSELLAASRIVTVAAMAACCIARRGALGNAAPEEHDNPYVSHDPSSLSSPHA